MGKPSYAIPATVTPARAKRLDRFLTNRFTGAVAFMLIMLAMFSSIFLLAQYPMDLIQHFLGWVAAWATRVLPAGHVRHLVTEGLIAGVGSVLVFLPQILLLFFFISVLEDSGYMARAALMMDHIMGRVGLPGRAFVPLLCSFACAIPGILGARIIKNPKDRLVTILIAPLMCCSARWPVFFLLAGAVIPNQLILGFLPLPALVLFGLLMLGIVSAVLVAIVFKRTILQGRAPSPALDLPPYHLPRWGHVFYVMGDRGLAFLRKAGTVILIAAIAVWALASYPKREGATPQEQIHQSWAGAIGRAIEPLIRPLGFDWKIGIAMISSFASREVFVSTMGTVYGVNLTDLHDSANLQAKLRKETDPATGRPFYNPLRAINIMIFYVLSMQCVSTLIVVGRETNHWKWALFQWGYMTGLAWVACFVVWQAGRLLGWA